MKFRALPLALALPLAVPLAMLGGCGGSGGEQGKAAEPAEETSSAAAVPASTSAPASASAPTSQPPAAFATCRSCHSVEPGKNGVGPSLFGIVGTRAGDVPGYNFSPALKNSGVTWDRQSLDTWLQGPMKMVPGTKMVIGVPNPEKRKEVIDYLETLK
ncbi:cytochrome c family protein [Novosphingobium sp.]|uniref:c-type cytochrome n=1 Tax=Novosphingobium sp. TaxID=1874826 RepID=UPI001855B4BB|nr:c-type cytochrome [Novosphingobium sp.]